MKPSEQITDLTKLSRTISRGTAVLGFILGASFNYVTLSFDMAWWGQWMLLTGEGLLLSGLLRWSDKYVLRNLLMVYRSGFADGLGTAAKVYRQVVRFKGRGDRL